MYLNKILFLLLSSFFMTTILCQEKQIQTYNYDERGFEIFVVGPYSLPNIDTLIINVEIRNTEDELFVFNDIKYLYVLDSNTMIIELGGSFEAGYETIVKLKKLNIYETNTYELKVSKSSLKQMFNCNYLNMAFSLGVVKDKSEIEKHKYSSLVETKIDIDSMEISSIILEQILYRIKSRVFSIKID